MHTLANQPASPAFARPSGSKGIDKQTHKTKNQKTAQILSDYFENRLKASTVS